ncbi:uncharacterized protein Z518_10422 [Rhinocladiella mackenziei CBS 650.93]|uniref:O-methylsterigmatocystin oxidoreductase n=1 Tax=Rhinocladiella mackenziei CBS 650.93 TaxID=1442369 RepID=A0A0D2GPI5_9EURO|nr:uncharacterized protein Z518_10422 [Rhinocladiella mackenziei CBS 650.93]KIX00283.1 hypothetical protein Z518_10422 [Rhinocladiella mackenziei CBS 650.93]
MAYLAITMDISLLRVSILTIVGAVVFSVARNLLKNKKVVPTGAKPLPGPKGWPLVGNAFDIPKSHAWFKFKEWVDEYGPIYQVKAFGTTLVIISRESIANELLGLRGAIYSDRPALIMPRLITDNGFLGAIGWTDYWRRARRFAQSMLSTGIIQQSIPKQTTKARQMVIDLAKNPSKYAYWFEWAGVMASIKQIYGPTEERGPAEERLAAPGMYVVEFIPSLLYLPTWLALFKREARALVKRHWNYLAPLMQQQSEKYKNQVTESPESFARRYLKTKEDWGLTDREIVWVLSSIYGGVSRTSATAMQSIILNTCLFPEWQQRVQEEIDEVVGDQRLPDFNDFGSLPSVRAVIKESMRWRPVLSGGFPHAVTKDDVFEGYFIPKSAVIIPNQRAILRDEELYPDPDSFRPERWLKPGYPTYQEPLTTYPNLKRFAGFGHGRRICPGLEVTEKSLFLQVSSL